MGSITDENERSITIDFNFLDADKEYIATIYKDKKDTHYLNNPTSIAISKDIITKESSRTFNLAAGGGLAISLLLK